MARFLLRHVAYLCITLQAVLQIVAAPATRAVLPLPRPAIPPLVAGLNLLSISIGEIGLRD